MSSQFAEMLKTLDAADPLPKSESVGLGEFLEHEHFLVKVLAYVVEDGLHECRRVCRQWRQACEKLPVKIRSINAAHVCQVSRHFPSATTLRLNHGSVDHSNSNNKWMTALSKLTELRTLKLPLHWQSPFPQKLMPELLSMHHLQSLSIHVDDEKTFSVWNNVLGQFPNLISLDLRAFCPLQEGPEPITSLQGLRDLSCDLHVLIRNDGHLLFPSLTRLTGLKIVETSLIPPSQHPMQFQNLLPYVASLRSLDVQLFSMHPSFRDWLAGMSFPSLERLKLFGFDPTNSNFFATLQETGRLKKLRMICTMHENDDAFMDSVMSLTGLKSLTLEETSAPYLQLEMPESITAMTQLTRLVLKGEPSGWSLRHLTSMVNLEIIGLDSAPADLPDVLACMHHLTSLQLFERNGSCTLPSAMVQQLPKLKVLKLWNLDTEPDFLKSLAALSELREFRFIPRDLSMKSDALYSRLSLVSNLVALEIPHLWPMTERHVQQFKGHMPRLQKILFASEDIECICKKETQKNFLEHSAAMSTMLDAFPCLRRVSLIHLRFPVRLNEEFGQSVSIDLLS